MRHIFRSLVVMTIVAAPVPAQQEIENVAAFARLYGVARWFYPGDAAASLDWNRFAVHGVSRVRSARSPAELERTLEELFTPLGPGIEIGTTLPPKPGLGRRDPSLVAWHYRGVGISEGMRGPYSMKRVNRPMAADNPRGTAGVMSQFVEADKLRGRTIRMRARMRVVDPEASGGGGIWLRVDRPNRVVGFFDNMQDRPVRDTAWREYIIEGPVADDATQIWFGVLSTGSTTLDVDQVELAVRAEGGDWTPLDIPDASFDSEPARKAWAQNDVFRVTREKSAAAHGGQFVRMAPPRVRPTIPAAPPADSLETPFTGATVGVDLGRGLEARVRLSLTDAEASVPASEPPALAALRAAVTAVANPARRDDVDVRLADAIVAWNVFRHFYPYWNDLRVDWDARLRPLLQVAAGAAGTREAHLDAIRALVAEVRDGHGNVRDVSFVPRLGFLPVLLRIIDGRLVVIGSNDASVPVGSIVTAIDGVPATQLVEKEMRLASGTEQWRESRAESALRLCRLDAAARLTIEQPGGAMSTPSLPCSRTAFQVKESLRPDSIAEVEPGIWYVDLTRVRATGLPMLLPKIAKARGVVFDIRGYPTDAGAAILPYLMPAAEDSATDRWMHVPRIAGPFGQIVDWQSVTWNVKPATPHIAARRVFLTDGRAISYAESVMGHVRDHRLGTIVGGATAGANGNVAGFNVPGGFAIMFTGMRVTRHDGRTPFHMAGVSPDVPMEPTLAGIRAGQDEVLERALSLLRTQP